MPHKHNGKVIYYPLRWASDHIQLDLDAVYDHSEADGLYLENLFDLLEENQQVRQALAEGRFRHIEDPSSEFATRIRRDYDGYGIPRFRIQ